MELDKLLGHYRPTRIHWAYTATMIHVPHYKPDNGPRYKLHYDPRYMPSQAAMHAGPTTATSHCSVGQCLQQESNDPDCCWGSDEVC